MRLELTPRPSVSATRALTAPLAAVAISVALGALLFAAMGVDAPRALYAFFVEPFTEIWSLHELTIKAVPLVLVAAGLCVAFRAGVWNIGAEGQFIAGALAASAIPVLAPSATGPWVLPVMFALGLLGGAAWALVPAVLKARFGASEILVSLMLVYVAELLLDFLVRGPWRNPEGFNFPETRSFGDSATLGPLIETGEAAGRANAGLTIALVAAIATFILLARTLRGFSLTLAGESPKAARFAGFSAAGTTIFAFLYSGALAGLAGTVEVAGALGQLRPDISPGYGFTAIIVAFLARLNPLGAIVAGVAIALIALGGEGAQISVGLSDRFARVFQGFILFAVLGAEALVRYRVRLVRAPRATAAPA